jgi:hypothetical protein
VRAVRVALDHPGVPDLPPQVYSTTLFDRERPRQLRFLVVPARSLETPAEDPVDVATRLGLVPFRTERPYVRPLEGWSLPFLLDAITDSYPLDFPWVLEILYSGASRSGEGPTEFAQKVAYAPLIPFEESPVRGRSLATLLTTGGATGAVAAYAESGKPVVVLVIAGSVVLFTGVGVVARRLEVASGGYSAST